MPKHIATFFVLLLIFLAAFVAGEKQFSPSFQSCLSQQPADKDDSLGAAVTNYARCTGEFVDAHGGAITAVASLIIAAFTGTLWIATIQQGKLTFASVELAHRELVSTRRSRLVVRFIQGPMYDATDQHCVSLPFVKVGDSLS